MGDLNVSEQQGAMIVTAVGKFFTEEDRLAFHDLVVGEMLSGHDRIIVDLREAWISSIMIGVLVAAHKQADQVEGRLVLVMPDKEQLTPLMKLFDYYATVDEALAAVEED